MARMSDQWLPLREFQGKDRLGRVVTKACYGNPHTGEVHHPTKDGDLLGWNGEPPNPTPGAPEREGVERRGWEAYRANWSRIFEQQKEADDGRE